MSNNNKQGKKPTKPADSSNQRDSSNESSSNASPSKVTKQKPKDSTNDIQDNTEQNDMGISNLVSKFKLKLKDDNTAENDDNDSIGVTRPTTVPRGHAVASGLVNNLSEAQAQNANLRSLGFDTDNSLANLGRGNAPSKIVLQKPVNPKDEKPNDKKGSNKPSSADFESFLEGSGAMDKDKSKPGESSGILPGSKTRVPM